MIDMKKTDREAIFQKYNGKTECFNENVLKIIL